MKGVIPRSQGDKWSQRGCQSMTLAPYVERPRLFLYDDLPYTP